LDFCIRGVLPHIPFKRDGEDRVDLKLRGFDHRVISGGRDLRREGFEAGSEPTEGVGGTGEVILR